MEIAKTSATVTETQIPFTPRICGSINTAEVSKIIKCKNEIIAEVVPSFNAVKNAEINNVNPAIKNENE